MLYQSNRTMETVAEHLAQNILKGTQSRLEKLKEIKAPVMPHTKQKIMRDL